MSTQFNQFDQFHQVTFRNTFTRVCLLAAMPFLLLTAGSPAMAQPAPSDMPPPSCGAPHHPGMGLPPELGLSAAQTQQIAAIHKENKPNVDKILEQLRQNHQEMQALLAGDATPEQLQQKHQQIQNLHQKMSEQHFTTMLKVHDVLTPQQRTRLAQLMQQHQERHGAKPPQF